MQIKVAEHLGMCFGVRDAINLATELTRRGPLTILGDLVHNPDVVEALDNAGARRAHVPQEISTPRVLLTAHGTSERVRLQLVEQGYELHDAVCPLVTRVHTALQKLVSEGRFPVIIGKADHVEVRGLTGDLADCAVILHENELEQLAGKPMLGVVAQTTQPLSRVTALVDRMRARFLGADIRFIDTVCQPTKDRQDALESLAADCDVVVVVGGRDSNNSRKLTELARKLGRRAYQVARAEELRPEWFMMAEVVGLTAGTSTPDVTIEAVRRRLEEIGSAMTARAECATAC